ncbi:YkvA family protein [Methylophaga sp.]|jgi:uncharacterized membrane protein YkvA (DUF1232 family)|uniref:YkvA family protein n=1 Tax=Methylophaga sp. TaxID=2024840 RepID=UPI001401408F|nr:YkvA family protein [Methylophaga sp.]MTI64552.1 DUF1232 domain-containing protein [Methylophaga sp.]
MSLKQRLSGWADKLKQHIAAIYYVYRDPETPMLTRWLALLVAAYAVSPIDLIPDFIPVIGYLDDLILLPLGCWLVIHSVPDSVWQRSLEKATDRTALPRFQWMPWLVVMLWIVVAAVIAYGLFA